MLHILCLLIILDVLNTGYSSYDGDLSRLSKQTDEQYEPVTMDMKDQESLTQNINCEDFSQFAINCTIEAAMMYNSSRMTPPEPSKMNDWCKAIKHLTNCAIDWNIDCKDMTDSHFNEESIKGHIHVANNICDDDMFMTRYEELTICIEGSESLWEECYKTFKESVEAQKNTTQEWTHYEVHFNLCCARASFRRCTLKTLFETPSICTHDQAVTLQKFSVIVSEGAVYQDCEKNVMYEECPGGDPRPSKRMLRQLVISSDGRDKSWSNGGSIYLIVIALVILL